MKKTERHCRIFKFEAEFSDNLRCLPMAVRRKLDLCGRKLRLQHWLELGYEQKMELLNWGDSELELHNLADRLKESCNEINKAIQEEWQQIDRVPGLIEEACLASKQQVPNLRQWQQLDELERFALLKLCSPGHSHSNSKSRGNLPLALREFLENKIT